MPDFIPGIEAGQEQSSANVLRMAEHVGELGVEGAERRLVVVQTSLDTLVGNMPPHLRPHQQDDIERISKTLGRVDAQMIEDGTGIAVIKPTGSGKTVEMAALASAFTAAGAKTLLLVPSYRILGQTVGQTDGKVKQGLKAFAPDVDTGTFSGQHKEEGEHAVVMLYQSIEAGLNSGFIEEFNPDIILCDEMQSLIDGQWAQYIRAMRKGRVAIGFTATPAYDENRHIRQTFPLEATRMHMREGIEKDILADIEPYIYVSETPFRIPKGEAVYGEDAIPYDEVYVELLEHPDNILAAKICAQEIAQGRKMLVACEPGMKTIHAKVMADLLSHTKIAGEDHYIRAAAVHGGLLPEENNALFRALDNGEIDVLTGVDLFSVGYDGLADGMVVLRDNRSSVAVEQRVGRILRAQVAPDGTRKIATLHEIVHPVRADQPPHLKHLNIVGEDVIAQGKARISPSSEGRGQVFAPDEELAARIAEVDGLALEELQVSMGMSVPDTWLLPETIATKFNLSLEDVEVYLGLVPSLPAVRERYGRMVTLYHPKLERILVKELGLLPQPDDRFGLREILWHYRERRYLTLGRKALQDSLADAGIEPEPYDDGTGHVILAYPPRSLEISPSAVRPRPHIKTTIHPLTNKHYGKKG